MPTLDEIYSAEWFAHDFEGLQPEFDLVAAGIFRQFRPNAAVDIGCGPGMVVGALLDLGVAAVGLDGSSHALSYAQERNRPFLQLQDITTMGEGVSLQAGFTEMRNDGYRLGPSRVVICTEVAEHLDEKHAAGLVRLLASGMCPIVFTAAPPGQDGHHHVNLQEKDYWESLFADHGCVYDLEASDNLRWRWRKLQRLSHMVRNVMVFT